ncbi:protein kinase [Lentisphaera marina]|uniref:serine/threonine-protein kinase n=1 Tax=Lentisphaera marina TaxID=1111041 RepID=UPI002366BB62|nr:serine/threonine-protein kinase [Lentisphaera marina]MDD7984145.1 protein kinase [Lentisphaera marina]
MSDDKNESEKFVENIHDLGHFFEKAFDDTDSPSPLFDKFIETEQRYEYLEKLDEGGSKTIHLVYDEQTYRPVAMAQLKDGENREKFDSFLSEAFLTASLEHPNIIPLYEAGLDESKHPYFTMKLVEGRNLSDLILDAKQTQSQEYSLQKLLDIFLKICDAIAFAHSRHVIHLDLKPDNIRIGTYGEVLVCDWGIAKLIEKGDETSHTQNNLDPNIINDHTLDGVIKGTLGFIAPEQIESNIGSKSRQTDIYQLGAILYNMLCLEKPIVAEDSKQSIQATLAGDIINPKKYSHQYFLIPESLSAVAMKALSTEPKDRYDSVHDLINEIVHWREGFATEAEDASFIRAISLLVKRHKAVSGLISFLFIITAFLVFQIKENEQEAIKSSNLAEYNESLAKESESRALEALALYKKEKALAKQAGIEASPRLVEMGEVHLHKGHFKEAERVFNRARDLNVDNEIALYFQALTQFVRQDFKQFLYLMKKKKRITPDSRVLINLAQKYSKLQGINKRLGFNDLVKLINEIPFTRPAYLLALDHHQSHPPRDQKHTLIKLILAKTNPHVKKWEYEIEDLPYGYNFDFRKTPQIRDLTALRGLPIGKLNLDACEVHDGKELSILLVSELSIRHTKMKKLGFILNMPPLKKLILDKSDHRGWNFSKYPRVKVERR